MQREKIQINKIKIKRGDIITKTKGFQMFIKTYFKNIHQIEKFKRNE